LVNVLKRLDDYGLYNNFNLKGRLMNVQTTKLSTITILCLLVFTVTTGLCSAQEWSRKGKTELFGTIQMLGGDEVDYSFTDELPVTLDLDGGNIYGIGLGYNMTDHWNLNTDLLFGSADADVKISGDKAGSEKMDYILWDINLDYNIWKERFTPLVTGGIGFMDFGIDIGGNVGEVDEIDFSYNLGAGVRWDVRDDLLLKLIYKSTWTELHDADGKQQFESFNLSVAYMY